MGSATALAGLPAFFELAVVAGLRESVERHVHATNREQGWTDWEVVSAEMMLNLAGGDEWTNRISLAAPTTVLRGAP